MMAGNIRTSNPRRKSNRCRIRKSSGLAYSKGGIVASITEREYSMGLNSKEDKFWLRLDTEYGDFDLEMTHWNEAMSSMKVAQADYGLGLGYGISRLHGALCRGTISGKQTKGTAYFQKVCVQAPSPPWFWGMLHFEDGSYIDWFLPHISPTLTAKILDNGKTVISHITHYRWADYSMMLTEKEVRNLVSKGRKNCSADGLPIFHVHMWNGLTEIRIEAKSVTRAHWTFDQPTRGGMKSHLTYNEYPLEVTKLEIDDELGIRNRKDWGTIRGNAEHSWGLLH